jgi:hypothetical protein
VIYGLTKKGNFMRAAINQNMKKQEKIFITAAIFILLAVLINALWRNREISKNGVYVLGKVKKIYDTENGLIYDFTYLYSGRQYHSHYKGFIKMQDSLIILKISKLNPNVWKYIDYNIPECVLKKDQVNKYWETLPNCK